MRYRSLSGSVRAVLLSFAGLVFGGVLALFVMAPGADGQPKTAEQKSADLVSAASVSVDPVQGYYSRGEAVRKRAAEVLEQVPFPPGRNSAASLNWDWQGDLTEGDVQELVQANAKCDWVLYAADTAAKRELTREELAILADLPAWSAVRKSATQQHLKRAVEGIRSGDWEAARTFLQFCRKPNKAPRPVVYPITEDPGKQ